MENILHQAVLVDEAINGLAIQPNGIYVDATFGRGGHTEVLLSHLNASGSIIAIDQDPEAIAFGKKKWNDDPRIKFFQASFIELQWIIENENLIGKINGVLIDLGVSTPQLDNPERGFSFSHDGPLDMRMNPEQTVHATQWINQATQDDIAFVLREYGEERYARRAAQAIVDARLEMPITRTKQLANIISNAIPHHDFKKNPATRSFQGIRIFINNELESLKTVLKQAKTVLAEQGRLVVISFHSLEDRIVKQFFLQQQGEHYPTNIPIQDYKVLPGMRVIAKKIRPSQEEIAKNPRARSATLRIGEKIR